LVHTSTTQTGSVHENVDNLTSETILLLVRKASELHSGASALSHRKFHGICGEDRFERLPWILAAALSGLTRLKNQVRYVPRMIHTLRSIWENGVSICELKNAENRVWRSTSANEDSLRDQVDTIIRRPAGSLELNALVNSIAGMRGYPMAVRGRLRRLMSGTRPNPRPIAGLDDVSFSKAGLAGNKGITCTAADSAPLNLRDQRGHCMLPLFPITGAASITPDRRRCGHPRRRAGENVEPSADGGFADRRAAGHNATAGD